MKHSSLIRILGITICVLLMEAPSSLGAQTARARTLATPVLLGTPSVTESAPEAAASPPAADSVHGDGVEGAPGAAAETMPADAPATGALRAARLFGYSGSLRAAVVTPAEAPAVEALGPGPGAAWVSIFPAESGLLGEPIRVDGSPAPEGPGIYLVESPTREIARALPVAVITTVPFDVKRGGYINGYHIGRYAAEGSGRSDRYAPPAGFIEVTPENQDFQISEHFRLRQFLTKDQGSVWPKYLALDLRLVDKLELVLQELNAMGVRADAMHVMSGFRTPQYNGPGGNGRATLSRHTYGDAADVWVDSDGDAYMDDLNGDGRANIEDARVMLRAVERVERRYPELVGGAGLYVANSAHGPFIHIDVRGHQARW